MKNGRLLLPDPPAFYCLSITSSISKFVVNAHEAHQGFASKLQTSKNAKAAEQYEHKRHRDPTLFFVTSLKC